MTVMTLSITQALIFHDLNPKDGCNMSLYIVYLNLVVRYCLVESSNRQHNSIQMEMSRDCINWETLHEISKYATRPMLVTITRTTFYQI